MLVSKLSQKKKEEKNHCTILFSLRIQKQITQLYTDVQNSLTKNI